MTTPTTSSNNTVTVEKEGSVVDWIEAIEKMNSTPGTPRQEAKRELSNGAESTSAAPTSIALTEKDGGVQIPTSKKATMRIVPQSPVEESNTVEETDARPMSPLEISGELKEEKNVGNTSPFTGVAAAEELRIKEIEKDVVGEGVDIPGSVGDIPEDRNSDTKTSTLDKLSTDKKEEVDTAQLFPLPVGATSFTSNIVADTRPIDSTSASNIIQENEETLPTKVQIDQKNSESEEIKILGVLENSSSKLSVDIPDNIKQDEAVLDGSGVMSNTNVLQKKEIAISEAPLTTSQPIAVEESKNSNTLEMTKTESVKEEKVVGIEKKLDTPTATIPAEISTSSSSQKEQQASDHKDASVPAATDTTQPPIQSTDEKVQEKKTTTDSQTVTEEPALPKPSAMASNPDQGKAPGEKKSLHLFTKLKRSLSTKNMKDFKEDPAPPTPTTAVSFLPSPTTATSSPNSSIEGSKHIELAKSPSQASSPTAASPRAGKKSDGLFKTLRAVMSFSSKRSPKSPTIIKTGKTPVPSPIPTRARTWDKKTPATPFSSTSGKSPVRPSTAKAVLKSSEKVPTLARPIPKSPLSPTTVKIPQFPPPKSQSAIRPRRLSPSSPGVMKASLRQAQTWSPGASTPVLASNPSAKMYTIWPRYPVVREQTDEVQAALEGFLPSDLETIEKGCAPGRDSNGDEVINFWKAPLTGEQAEVVKAIQWVREEKSAEKVKCKASAYLPAFHVTSVDCP